MISTAHKHLEAFADSIFWLPDKLRMVDLKSLKKSVEYRSADEVSKPLDRVGAHEFIRKVIAEDNPRLVARFGSTELRVALRSLGRSTRSRSQKLYALMARLEWPYWALWEHKKIRVQSGFYPINQESTERFVGLSLQSAGKLDLLGSWVAGENQLLDYCPGAAITPLSNLSPFGDKPRWTDALRGKKVLVIHPFVDSIEKQFDRRALLFEDSDFLPNFELRTLRAVQSLGTPPSQFPTWFDGLEFMLRQALKIEFDIALIGAGAYGLPLGAMLKKHGKSSLVLGGLVQLLFGIKGRRWDQSGLYNQHWVRPMSHERPDGFRGADNGAYW